ncbi:MAG: PQQ-dependent sugar dehydrogenase [candidate division Zixibacteria bacterium]|jgi:glucose/arabinose dehydrogenase|nr:PQQ-dependent sugar dehydrogenase [candidate division Zixibacteria bacterium]
MIRVQFFRGLCFLFVAGLIATTGHAQNPDTLTLSLQTVVSGLSNPIYITSAPNDSVRLFVLEREGYVRIIEGDSVLSQPMLDISDRVVTGGERGLLGMAFHPDFPDTQAFFLNYVNRINDTDWTFISRFPITGNPDIADPSAEQVILKIRQPQTNHNGGTILFGPDKYLYIGMGDGGGTGDPLEMAQSPFALLGKLLRIDVRNGAPYTVPVGNPWVGTVDTLPEIFAFGLRNPYRWSFDRVTADLWIADVGQFVYEEVNVTRWSDLGGQNYGWDITEGFHCYEPASNCDSAGLDHPIFEYNHNNGRCSITGGHVYRGCAIPDLTGWYIYGDYCTGQIWRLKVDSAGNVDSEFGSPMFDVGNFDLATFGEDYYGELYIAELNTGRVRKIVHDGAVEDYCAGPPDPCCIGTTGNVNADSEEAIDLSDLIWLVNYLFLGGPSPDCPAEANTNGDSGGSIDLSDLIHLVNYLFLGGSAPADCA